MIIEEAEDGNITNLDGLTAITDIEASLRIIGNETLTGLEGLQNLSSIGGLSVQDNFALNSLVGLGNLQSFSLGIIRNIEAKSDDNAQVNTAQIDISQMSKGLYFISLQTTQGTFVEKVVVH